MSRRSTAGLWPAAAGLLLLVRTGKGGGPWTRGPLLAAAPARWASHMGARMAASAGFPRHASSGDAVAVLRLLLRAASYSPDEFAMLRLQLLLERGEVRFRAVYRPSGELRVLYPKSARDATFLTEHFGSHRVLVVETKYGDEIAPPRELAVGELRYELVCSKVRNGKREPTAWHYVATSGGGLPRIELASELQRVGDFAAVERTSKLAARLELLCSRVPTAKRMRADLFHVVPDISPAGALGAAMADGCGFAPEWLVTELAACAGALEPERAAALQVRVFCPTLGVFKGMLMRRPGLERVQLSSSMRKVPPSRYPPPFRLPSFSESPAGQSGRESAHEQAGDTLPHALRLDEALVCVKLVHPTRANVLRVSPGLRDLRARQPLVQGATLRELPDAWPQADGGTGARSRPAAALAAPLGASAVSAVWQGWQAEPLPTAPSEMVLRVWKALGLSEAQVAAYCERSLGASSPAALTHASLSGVADPFASLPAGSVFAAGVPGSRLFVTRFPCVKPADGRVLPLVTRRPQSMLPSQWEFLQRLPFGMLVFSVRGERPLPEVCGQGDLDGDLYFACWDEAIVLPNLSPRAPSPNPRVLPKPPPPALAIALRAAAGAPRALDLASVYAHLADLETLHAGREIGRVYRLWEAVVAQRRLGMDDPDALLLADAYIQALDAGKHGGDHLLPPHLLELLAQPPSARNIRPEGGRV
ncbi:RNA dependent RNA polymerase-domain-containing protein [Pavlovales sp. CCMP2436]|nr:RNA dependent RNA polymerase-domain-containing protein [Pavlovales sp. CCMP2436]